MAEEPRDSSVWDTVANNANTIALILYNSYKHKFRYIGNGKWEYYADATTGATTGGVDTPAQWKPDERHLQMYRAMSTASAAATQRAMYWGNMAFGACSEGHDFDEDALMRRERLMKIAYALKSVTGRRAILREAREYFVFDQ
jgi:hypothetical protein